MRKPMRPGENTSTGKLTLQNTAVDAEAEICAQTACERCVAQTADARQEEIWQPARACLPTWRAS